MERGLLTLSPKTIATRREYVRDDFIVNNDGGEPGVFARKTPTSRVILSVMAVRDDEE